VRYATYEGLKAGAYSLAASTAVVLGATRLFPAFKRSLNVSAKTALIVSGCCQLLTSPPSRRPACLQRGGQPDGLVPPCPQISPAFGAFFLLGELAMNECAQKNRHLQRTAREAAARAAAHQ
jgi:hypothetical protein